jgi:hypothetical protein
MASMVGSLGHDVVEAETEIESQRTRAWKGVRIDRATDPSDLG